MKSLEFGHDRDAHEDARVLLYWLPLGAGGRSVRWNGQVFEALAAYRERRSACVLFHTALEVGIGTERFVIEMGPAWVDQKVDHGVVREGPVGYRWLGNWALFRYEVRCWRNGVIPDVQEAVGGPCAVGHDVDRARRLLELVPQVPALTWGRDEMSTGDMWNSNSLTAWLLARSGHDLSGVRPPAQGRAPGWRAGLKTARRTGTDSAAANRPERDFRPVQQAKEL